MPRPVTLVIGKTAQVVGTLTDCELLIPRVTAEGEYVLRDQEDVRFCGCSIVVSASGVEPNSGVVREQTACVPVAYYVQVNLKITCRDSAADGQGLTTIFVPLKRMEPGGWTPESRARVEFECTLPFEGKARIPFNRLSTVIHGHDASMRKASDSLGRRTPFEGEDVIIEVIVTRQLVIHFQVNDLSAGAFKGGLAQALATQQPRKGHEDKVALRVVLANTNVSKRDIRTFPVDAAEPDATPHGGMVYSAKATTAPVSDATDFEVRLVPLRESGTVLAVGRLRIEPDQTEALCELIAVSYTGSCIVRVVTKEGAPVEDCGLEVEVGFDVGSQVSVWQQRRIRTEAAGTTALGKLPAIEGACLAFKPDEMSPPFEDADKQGRITVKIDPARPELEVTLVVKSGYRALVIVNEADEPTMQRHVPYLILPVSGTDSIADYNPSPQSKGNRLYTRIVNKGQYQLVAGGDWGFYFHEFTFDPAISHEVRISVPRVLKGRVRIESDSASDLRVFPSMLDKRLAWGLSQLSKAQFAQFFPACLQNQDGTFWTLDGETGAVPLFATPQHGLLAPGQIEDSPDGLKVLKNLAPMYANSVVLSAHNGQNPSVVLTASFRESRGGISALAGLGAQCTIRTTVKLQSLPPGEYVLILLPPKAAPNNQRGAPQVLQRLSIGPDSAISVEVK